MTIQLDGRAMCSRSEAHDHLKERLALPDYYGRNLDALYDLLTERGEPTLIELCYFRDMESALGGYAKALVSVMHRAAEQNPSLYVRAFPETGEATMI